MGPFLAVSLKRFRRQADAAVLHPPFEPLSRPLYIILASEAAAAALLLTWFGFRLHAEVWALLAPWPVIAAGGIAFRRIGFPRIATTLETFAVIHGQAFLGSLLLVGVTPFHAPYADALLSGWDKALGFPWLAVVDALRGHEAFWAFAYDSFRWQSVVLILYLGWNGSAKRLWVFVAAATVSLAISALFFGFMPALAPYHYYGAPHYGPYTGATKFLEPLEYIRQGGQEFTLRLFSGCITFPSYHAACAALFCWATWPTVLRWPILALNVLMVISTIPVGGHYFVDIPAGLGVALVSFAVSRRLVERTEARSRS